MMRSVIIWDSRRRS